MKGVKIINGGCRYHVSNTGKKENVVSARKKEEARREACRMFRDGTPLIRVGRGRCLVFPVIKTLPVNRREREREIEDRDIKRLAILSIIDQHFFFL